MTPPPMTTTRARCGNDVTVEDDDEAGSTGAAALTRRPYPPVESREHATRCPRQSRGGNTHSARCRTSACCLFSTRPVCPLWMTRRLSSSIQAPSGDAATPAPDPAAGSADPGRGAAARAERPPVAPEGVAAPDADRAHPHRAGVGPRACGPVRLGPPGGLRVLARHCGSALGPSASALKGQEGLDVIRATGRGRIERHGCIPHHGAERRELDMLGGLRVTGLADTWVDLGEVMARGLDTADLVVVGDEVANRRPVASLAAVLARRVRPRNSTALSEALTLIRAGVRSPMETRARLMFHRAGFPEPEVNAAIYSN